MAESTEGVGFWKWSFEPVNGELFLNQGKYRLARLEPLPVETGLDQSKVRGVLVTAPQLWDAANELVKEWQRQRSIVCTTEMDRLMNAVAKAVGKTTWSDVAQAL